MTQIKIRIRIPRSAGAADLEVVTPGSVDATNGIAQLVSSLGIKPWRPHTVRTPLRSVTHVGITEPDGSGLTSTRAAILLDALRATLSGGGRHSPPQRRPPVPLRDEVGAIPQ